MNSPEPDRQEQTAAEPSAEVTAPGAIPEAAPPGAPTTGARPTNRRLALGAVVVVAAVAVGGGVVYATSHVATSDTAGAQRGGFGNGFAGRQGVGSTDVVSGALHGEFVVSDGNGGYTTMVTQTGSVTAVSATSLTVRSTDGHTARYAVAGTTRVDDGAATITSVRAGHAVTVLAAKTGMKASTVTDTTLTGGAQGTGQTGTGTSGRTGGNGQTGTGGQPGNGNGAPNQNGGNPPAGPPGGTSH